MWTPILRHYDGNGRQRALEELAWFASQPNLSAAIKTAALAIDGRGKRYSHQRRIARARLEEGRRRLAEREAAIRKVKNFASLISLVADAVDGVRGLGELWRYDTALRIGAFLHLEPEVVYLHAGTRVGARALGINARSESITMGAICLPSSKGLHPVKSKTSFASISPSFGQTDPMSDPDVRRYFGKPFLFLALTSSASRRGARGSPELPWRPRVSAGAIIPPTGA